MATHKSQPSTNLNEIKNEYLIIEKEKQIKPLPAKFFREVVEAENLYISKPSCEACEKLLLLYKTAAEHYSKYDRENEEVFVKQIQKTIANPTAMKLFAAKENKQTKKVKKQNFQFLLEKYNLNSIDYGSKAKEIIKNYQDNMKNALALLKTMENNQKKKFKQNTKIKTIKNTLLNDDEEKDDRPSRHTKNRNSNRNSTLINLHNSVMVSSRPKGPGLRHMRALVSSSDFDVEGFRNSLKGQKDQKNESNSKFVPKPDTSTELINFLKDYNKKLYFLFQTTIGESMDKLNKILDKTYRKKINRHFEYQDNIGEFELMLDDENMKDEVNGLISSVKKEYDADIEKLEIEQNKKMNKLSNHYSKNELKDNVVIGNLNVETLGEVIKVFK